MPLRLTGRLGMHLACSLARECNAVVHSNDKKVNGWRDRRCTLRAAASLAQHRRVAGARHPQKHTDSVGPPEVLAVSACISGTTGEGAAAVAVCCPATSCSDGT